MNAERFFENTAARSIPAIVAVAAILRAGTIVLGSHVALPDSGGDAARFEAISRDLAANWSILPDVLRLGSSFFYSIAGAALYSVTGRIPLLLQVASAIVGTWSVYLVWLLGRETWEDDGLAAMCAWASAVFPTLILYSALTLREPYITACLLLALIFVGRWVRTNRLRDAAGATAAILVGAVFHTGLLVAAVMFFLVFAWRELRVLGRSARHGRLSPWRIVPTAVIIAAALAVLVINPRFAKLGRLHGIFTLAPYQYALNSRLVGEASYPMWMELHSAWDLVWLVPLRVIYLLFSPFPWDVRTPGHLIGLADGLLYLVMAVGIAVGWNSLRRNRSAVVIGIILLALILFFAIGTGNFGTAVRHRSVFAAGLMVLAVAGWRAMWLKAGSSSG